MPAVGGGLLIGCGEPSILCPQGKARIFVALAKRLGERMPIRWEDVGHEKYEDMVSVLLSRLYPDARRIDGKGGDGGRDVQIADARDGSIMGVFELKGFTGRVGRSQRRQIESSLRRATELNPPKWTLVVPIDPNPSELRWFDSLRGKYGFSLVWCGKTWLDEKMAAHRDIQRYFLEGAKDEVYELLRELGNEQEEARVVDVAGAVARMEKLHGRLNEIDPHYLYVMGKMGPGASLLDSKALLAVQVGDVLVEVFPKYRGATDDRPITMNLLVALGAADAEIREALEYGTSVTLPGRLVKGMTLDAPGGLGGDLVVGEFSLWPLDTELEERVTLSLDIMDGDDLVISCPIVFTKLTSGPRGMIYSGTDSTGWLELDLKVNLVDEEFQGRFHWTAQRGMPRAVLPVLKWIDACRPPNRLRVCWPEGPELVSEIESPMLRGDSPWVEIVEAVAYVQECTRIYREMPLEMTEDEAEEALRFAALLRGETVDFTWRPFVLNVAQWKPEHDDLVGRESSAFIVECEIGWSFDGTLYPIGRVRNYFPWAVLADVGSVRQKLADGMVPALRFEPGENDQGQQMLVRGLD